MSQKLARAFASEAISNSHAGIKACWLIVFSAGTFAALSTMKDVLIQVHWFNGTVPPDKHIDQHPFVCFLLFMVFVLTFLRFYIGGVRVFDIRYSEIFKLVNTELSEKLKDATGFKEFVRNSETFRLLNTEDPKDSKDLAEFKKSVANSDIFKQTDTELSEDRFKQLVANSDQNLYKFEVVTLTFQSLIVVFLAFQIGDWLNFAKVYTVLLLWNVCYLGLNRLASPPVIAPIFDEIFPAAKDLSTVSAMFPMRTSLIWIGNNIFFGGAILAGLFYHSSVPSEPDTCGGILLCIGVLLNCGIDFFLARDFYFPRFSEFLEKS